MEWLDLTLDIFFPEPCPSCGGVPVRSLPMSLCGECSARLWSMPRPVQLVDGPRLVMTLGRYEGPLGRALLIAKVRSRARMLRGIGSWAAERLEGRLPEVDAVVPVPSSMHRGVEAAAELSGPIAARLGVPVLPLVQRFDTDGQRGRDAAARRLHAARSYRVPVPERGLPDRVLLIDDVCTTGSTLRACADELLGAGVRRVYAVALAAAGADYLDGVEGALGEEGPTDNLWSMVG
jgi:predicted amidophosphoribosyltransferase